MILLAEFVVTSSLQFTVGYLTPSPPPGLMPEAQVATKLIEAIRAKEDVQNMLEIIDSLTSVNPELSLDRNSKMIQHVLVCV